MKRRKKRSLRRKLATGQSNERLEFLGDAVVDLAVSEYLFENVPHAEGRLTRIKAVVVSGPTLAARITDPHICPMVDGVKPHVGGPITMGCPTVTILGQPAARVGDAATCTGPPDAIAKGSATVQIGGMPSARFLDQTVHGGMIVMGAPTVIIGG